MELILRYLSDIEHHGVISECSGSSQDTVQKFEKIIESDIARKPCIGQRVFRPESKSASGTGL
jgi:hypothetical protein